MSARLVRRILKEKEDLRGGCLLQEPDPDDAEELESPISSSRGNIFSLLSDQEANSDASTSSPPRISEREDSESGHPSEAILNLNYKKKKKNKKVRKKSSKNVRNTDEKLLETVVESLSVSPNHHPAGMEAQSKSDLECVAVNLSIPRAASILSVGQAYLKGKNELRKIFGSKVVSFAGNGNSNSSSLPGGRRGNCSHRKTLLISPASHWPRWDGSLSMELLETKNAIRFFRYVNLPSYVQAQSAFEAAKATHDVNAIANVLVHHPYHIQSLLSMAEAMKFLGDHQRSADYVGMCLYALECAWHPLFTPLQGNCQLKYAHDSNKPFFSVLFTHMQTMNRQGCHRTALEMCKFLLSLDSDDPVGAILCIDCFALRAEEYAWLEKFADEYRSGDSRLFPNITYSLAVSRFYLEKNCFSHDEKGSALDLMKQALMLHPLVLKKLVAKVPMKDFIWATILNHVFFGSAKAGGLSLDHLINIYVEQSYLLWRLPELQRLLKEAALLVIESLNVDGNEARDWDRVRKEAFPRDRNGYAHLLVSDFSDSLPTILPDDLRDMVIGPHISEAMRNGYSLPVEEESPLLGSHNPFMLLIEELVFPLSSMRSDFD